MTGAGSGPVNEDPAGLRIRNPKQTSQEGLLERLLTRLRTRQIRPHLRGATVLDFGCGEHLGTLRNLGHHFPTRLGYDILFQGLPPQQTSEGIRVFGDLADIDTPVDCITALAVFEHLHPGELVEVLRELARLTAPGGRIVGTVPRPPSRPVLEFLSYRLRLIDPSQIRDHKVYYDREALRQRVREGGWELVEYRTFQLGLNSLFVLEPHRATAGTA